MAIHIVWTADPKQAEQAAGQLARKITVIQEKHRALTGEAQKSSQVYQRGMKANFKCTEDARRGLGAMEKDLRRAQAEYAKAQKKAAAADKARADSAKKTAAAQKKTVVALAALRDKVAKKQAAVEATLAAARQKHAKKQQAEEARLLAIRKRLYEETRTPQERYAAKMRELNALAKKGTITEDVKRRAAKQAAEEAADSGSQQLNIGRQVLGQLSSIAGALGVTGGIAGAIALMKQGFENSLEVMREITNETSKASDEIVAFTALQEGGTKAKRVMAASALGAHYGVTERGVAFDTVQAMQSMLGDFEQGMKVSKDIFAASQVGIPVELGKELEIRGIASGMAPGEAIRKAFVAGELSGRTPAELPKAAEAMPYWEDKNLMFAVAGQLAASAGDQISTYMKRLGQVLSPVGGLEEWYKEQGISEDASQFKRLEAISKAGLTTQTLLTRAGVTEKREMLAVLNAMERFEQIAEDMEKIPKLAIPELFAAKRAGIEAEMPWMRTAREMRVHAAGYAAEKAFGEDAPAQLRKREEQIVRGRAFQRMGMPTIGGFRTYQEEQVEGAGTVPVSTVREEAKANFGLFLKHILFASGTAPGQAITPAHIAQQPISGAELTARLEREKQAIRREVEATAPGGLRQDIRELRDAVDRQTDALTKTTETQTDRLETATREQTQAAQPETRVIEAPALVEAL